MQVSNQTTASYSPIDTPQDSLDKIQDLTQEQRDTLRETTALKAKKESKEAQIEAYVAGSQQSNESSNQNDDYVQNYTDFAADVRRANSYTTLVENGVDISDIKEREDLPDPSDLDQDQKDSLREGVASFAGQQSTQDKIDAYKAGSEQSSSIFYETQQSVQNYNEFAADVRRSNGLNTYIEYNNY